MEACETQNFWDSHKRWLKAVGIILGVLLTQAATIWFSCTCMAETLDMLLAQKAALDESAKRVDEATKRQNESMAKFEGLERAFGKGGQYNLRIVDPGAEAPSPF